MLADKLVLQRPVGLILISVSKCQYDIWYSDNQLMQAHKMLEMQTDNARSF